MEYIKHFNQESEKYLYYRPDYPQNLFTYLSTLANSDEYVWDCGTGNGQAALALTKHFAGIIATDINFAQLAVGLQDEKVHYVCCLAEQTPIPANSISLITVAQALHWFNFPDFYQEVRRVAKPDAFIAAWCYSLGKLNSELDPIINKLYQGILGDEFWPKQRHFIDEQFQTIPFPFQKMTVPTFLIEKKMNFFALIGYLNTWSAVKEYQQRVGNGVCQESCRV